MYNPPPRVNNLQTIQSMAAGIKRPDGRGDLRVELLTAGLKASARQKLLDDVRAGEVGILEIFRLPCRVVWLGLCVACYLIWRIFWHGFVLRVFGISKDQGASEYLSCFFLQKKLCTFRRC